MYVYLSIIFFFCPSSITAILNSYKCVSSIINYVLELAVDCSTIEDFFQSQKNDGSRRFINILKFPTFR